MPSDELLPIGEVARLTGVNPVTLRAWERRYGLIKPQRTPKGHRLYPQDQVQRVQAALRWLERGAAISQVRELLDNTENTPPTLQGEWGERIEQLIMAIARLAQRPLDQQLNQVMALYPAVTVCERLLLPLLEALTLRWQTHFDARLEQVFFHTWLRSKLGARVYHDGHSLTGTCVLLARTDDTAFDPEFWLCAWLLSSNGHPLEILEWSVEPRQLRQAVERLQPQALLLHLGRRPDLAALGRMLRETNVRKLLGGSTVTLHEAELRALSLTNLSLFDSPQAALRGLQQP
ncbi:MULTISPECIES: MerR family transcriptional regulator [Pseudomonas]|jgi:DNA-binding transcriptional MerR regulator|uniref:Helix-turn-helix-type transcriptional regulator n=1 Tax=Pseudomonas soli TaxID=1306993 RepID=A0A2V4IFI7_9PSED|nr:MULTISPECIES: MerR family transcriptional regulator [Pseudomonas]PYB76806.1 helix-turn-helix-type transcriptional regulator [Pseudomonas soli]PZW86320.1 MerR family transcriptional regulator [Pseudomonas sp. 2848]QWA29331.1 MerR family transcriptional regulator [Pseudomonas sp. RC3H12]